MKPSKRLTRINDEIMREAAEIIKSEIKDPRISTITSVTKAVTTNDLKQCKLYISIMGNDEQKKEVLQGLRSSAGFIRKMLASNINLRNTPELSFVIDDSLDYSYKIDSLLKKVIVPDEIGGSAAEGVL